MTYRAWFDSILNVKSQTADEVSALCPFHDDSSPSLSLNVNSGLWVCYGCGEKGNARQLAAKIAHGHDTPPEQELDLDTIVAELEGEEKQYRYLDESYLDLFGLGHPYWTERFGRKANSVVRQWGLGYDPITNAVTIPHRTRDGRLLGVIRRKLDDTGPKYLYPKGFPKKDHLWGMWQVRSNSVVLVEGALDAAAVWNSGAEAVAILGSMLSKEQVRVLEDSGTWAVVLFFDNDEAGRRATEVAKALLDNSGLLVYEVDWSKWKQIKDPGEADARGVVPELLASAQFPTV